MIKVPEMIVSFLFLATGIYLVINAAEVTTMMIVKYILVFASIPLAIIGFKKSKKPLAIISVLLIIGAYGLAEMSKSKKVAPKPINAMVETNQAAESYDVLAHGKALYLSQCAVCHGEKGKKGLSGAKDLSISKLSKIDMHELIANGKNTMPAYGNNFSREEIEAMVVFVKTLKVELI
jgi:cytochrome c5